MQKQKSGFSLLFLIFLICTRQVAWQGYGNMSSSNLTAIWTFINANIGSHTSTSSYDTFNTDLSSHLNTLWDPAWNVLVVKTTNAYDTVLYGYAFRDHWMWYNDYRINGVILAFVIWKDYNCNGNWKIVGKNGSASGFAVMKNDIEAFSWLQFQMGNLWNGAKQIVDKLITKSEGGYSVVACQQYNSEFYGKICVKENNYFYYYADGDTNRPFYKSSEFLIWGNALVFQTR